MGKTGFLKPNWTNTTAVRLFARLIYCFYLAYYNTLRIRVINEQYAAGLPPGKNCIYACWHSKTFLIFGYARNCKPHGNFKIAILTLLDWKNVIFARWCGLMRFETVPVSSTVGATIRLKRMLQEGYHVALALDGPKGPVGTVKPGAFFLARKTGAPVIAVACHYQKSFRLRHRWDHYEVPFPFTQVTLIFNRPVEIRSEDESGWESGIKPLLGTP